METFLTDKAGLMPASQGHGGLAWADILACEGVVLRFTAAFDANDLDAMLVEFAAAGVWIRQDGTLHGHDGIRGMMAARPPGLFVRHIITNLRVAADAAGSAICTSYLTVYRHDDGGDTPLPLGKPSLVGRYHDQLILTGQQWLLSSRRVSVDFKS